MIDNPREMTATELDALPPGSIVTDGEGVAWTRIRTIGGRLGWHYHGPDSEFPDWPSAVLAANGPHQIIHDPTTTTAAA